jgi:hypothetical protein
LVGGGAYGKSTTNSRRLANAHGVHRLNSHTQIRLAEIERDRTLQITRLEHNDKIRPVLLGEPLHCIMSLPHSVVGEPLSRFVVPPLVLPGILRALLTCVQSRRSRFRLSRQRRRVSPEEGVTGG